MVVQFYPTRILGGSEVGYHTAVQALVSLVRTQAALLFLPVAQLDRVFVLSTKCRKFEPCQEEDSYPFL